MKKMPLLLFLFLVGLNVDAATKPKPPVLKICASTTGKLLAKSKCSSSEVTLTASSIVGAPGPQGPQGPQGFSGFNGTFDPNKCVYRGNQADGNTALAVTLNCFPGEYLLTHGAISSALNTDIISMALLFRAGEQAASGVTYFSGTNGGSFNYSFLVQGVCCVP